MDMRRVLAHEKNIENIRDEVREMEGEAIYHGAMLLDGKFYPLVNIEVSPPGDNKPVLLTTDVADHSLKNGEEGIVRLIGNMTLTIVPSVSGDLVGEGKLIINNAQHEGAYRVWLTYFPST